MGKKSPFSTNIGAAKHHQSFHFTLSLYIVFSVAVLRENRLVVYSFVEGKISIESVPKQDGLSLKEDKGIPNIEKRMRPSTIVFWAYSSRRVDAR